MFSIVSFICFTEKPSPRSTSILTLIDTVIAVALLTLGALIMKGTLFPNNTTAACCLLTLGGLQSFIPFSASVATIKGKCCPSKKTQQA